MAPGSSYPVVPPLADASTAGGVLETEQGEVVGVAAAAVPLDRGHQLVQDVVEGAARPGAVEGGGVDELPLGVARLDQPVGVADQPLAGPEQANASSGRVPRPSGAAILGCS